MENPTHKIDPILIDSRLQFVLALVLPVALLIGVVAGSLDLAETSETVEPYRLTLDLNEATSAELQLVPGIGKVTADRIIAERQRTKGFRSLDDVLHVVGVGPKTLLELKRFCDPIVPDSAREEQIAEDHFASVRPPDSP